MKTERLSVVGDGRYDLPGHSAKFDTYTIMNANSNEIIDFFIAHVSNAGGSSKMELYAFKKVLDYLTLSGLEISTITTDRHKSISKHLRQNCPNIIHQFDLWHFSRKIKKGLLTKGKQKRNENLAGWIKSIINHFWWCSAACQGNAVLIREKWLSILHHVSNKHEWDGHELYQACEHGPLSPEEERLKKWLPESLSSTQETPPLGKNYKTPAVTTSSKNKKKNKITINMLNDIVCKKVDECMQPSVEKINFLFDKLNLQTEISNQTQTDNSITIARLQEENKFLKSEIQLKKRSDQINK